jgi:hypothetical protein
MTQAEHLLDRPQADALLTPVVRLVVAALPSVRPEAVGRARLLLASTGWCRADEVADRLIDCMVGLRVP